MPGARGSQDRLLISLELDLWMVMGYHMGVGNWTWGPLQEQQMLTAEPFLQRFYTVLNCEYYNKLFSWHCWGSNSGHGTCEANALPVSRISSPTRNIPVHIPWHVNLYPYSK